MRRSFPLSVALLTLLALPVILAPRAAAQINAPPTSVTSPGFGGRAVNGPRSSVTSLGPNGYTGGYGPGIRPPTAGHHHRHHFVPYTPPVAYALPVPYAVDIGDTDEYSDSDADENDPNYQGGPTIFDRRGAGAESYVPPVRKVPRPHANNNDSADQDPSVPEAPQEPTVLIFKDGHKLEVGNYAIVGATLFDLTPGHARRIALTDLDLEATRKQNDEHGVIFQLPPTMQAN